MKTLDLESKRVDLAEVINMASTEPVLLLTADGREFVVSEADDFEREVETLRASPAFQKFLEDRSACRQRIPLAEVVKEIDAELAEKKKSKGRKTSRTRKR